MKLDSFSYESSHVFPRSSSNSQSWKLCNISRPACSRPLINDRVFTLHLFPHCGVGLGVAVADGIVCGVGLGASTGLGVGEAVGDGELSGVAVALGVGVGLSLGCMFIAFLSISFPSGPKTICIPLFWLSLATSCGTATAYCHVDPTNLSPCLVTSHRA